MTRGLFPDRDGAPPLPPENVRRTRPKDLSRGPLAVADALVSAFSTTSDRRPPPSPTKTRHVRLITIGVSHYCEKVRWALDLLEDDPESDVYYTEDAHPPVFAAFSTVRASWGEWSAAPMIVLDEPLGSPGDGGGGGRRVIYDSQDILRSLCPRLYPPGIADEVARFERDLGERLGATSRCWAYHQLLVPEYRPLLVHLATAHTSAIESALFRRMLPRGIDEALRKVVGVTDESAEASLASIREVFREVSDRLDGGRRAYLFNTGGGPAFTAADLTFASLASVLLVVPEMGAFYPGDGDPDAASSAFPPRFLELREELRSTAAGRHALRMYGEHRFRSGDAGPAGWGRSDSGGGGRRLVIPKSARRNRVPWLGGLVAVGAVTAIVLGVERFRRARL